MPTIAEEMHKPAVVAYNSKPRRKAYGEATHDNYHIKMIQEEIPQAFRDFRGTSYNSYNYEQRR